MKKNIILFWIIFLTHNYLFSNDLFVEKISSDLYKPIYLTAPNYSSDTLFIAEQNGLIKYIINGKTSILFDIRDRVHQPRMPGDERGLLGICLHPDFRKNGQFFVNYVSKNDSTIISKFVVDLSKFYVNTDKEEIIVRLLQPYPNHNGGQIAFGPDKNLYIGFGDGGYAGDPNKHGQNKNSLFGSIIRIDIDKGSPYFIPNDNPFYGMKNIKEEIWCYGLRNPWRFSFDRINGDLYIADVGQSQWEEINYTPFNEVSGINYGWNEMEGAHCYPIDNDCNKNLFTKPIFEYPNNANYIKTLIGWQDNNAKGCSVTGGYVYRGESVKSLQGVYLFGDYCTGKIWSFEVQSKNINKYKEWEINGLEEELYISSFAEDGNGELYIINHLGTLYKIINAN